MNATACLALYPIEPLRLVFGEGCLLRRPLSHTSCETRPRWRAISLNKIASLALHDHTYNSPEGCWFGKTKLSLRSRGNLPRPVQTVPKSVPTL